MRLGKRLSGGQHGFRTLLARSVPLFKGLYILLRASLVVQTVKNLPAIQETWIRSLTQEDLLKKGWVTHSSIPSWRIPWTEEPGGLQSTGSQKSWRRLSD